MALCTLKAFSESFVYSFLWASCEDYSQIIWQEIEMQTFRFSTFSVESASLVSSIFLLLLLFSTLIAFF